MKEKREFFRFEHERRGNFHLPGESEKWQECTVVDFSRNGITVFFYEKITIGSLCSFEIPIPEEETFITLTGTLQWAEESENGYKGGIALSTLLDDDNFRKLLTGHNLSGEITGTECQEDIQELSKEAPSSSRKRLTSRKAFLALYCLLSLLSLPLLFMVVRGYSSGRSFNHDQNKKDVVLKTIEVTPQTVVPIAAVCDLRIPEVDTVKPEQPMVPVSNTRKPHFAQLKDNGGSFSTLAHKHYQKANETIFDLIVQANPAITNVRRVSDRKKITLPVITPESYINKTTDGTYRVHIGTFETFELATVYSKRVDNSGKRFSIDAHHFSPHDKWYRLTMGDFSNRKDALKAVKLLEKDNLIYISPDA